MTKNNEARVILYQDRIHIIIEEQVFRLDQKSAERLLYSLHDCVDHLRGYQKQPSRIKRILRRPS